MEKIIGSLKEFIWDIIGFLIPGFLLIITINFFILPTIAVKDSFLLAWNLFNPTYVIVVIAYILGFLVYSLSMVKNNRQDAFIDLVKSWWFHDLIKEYHSKYWEIEFESSELFKAAKQKLEDDGLDNANNMTIKEVRNIYMSKNPEMDQKVYTFMFRSDLFGHITTILTIILLLVLLQIILKIFNVIFLKIDGLYLVLYILFPLLLIPLGNAKRKFYSISQRVPLSKLM